MAKFPLRDYQQDIIDRVRSSIAEGNKRIILQLPTGGGKTRIASEIIDLTTKKNKRALFTCHRQTLVLQAFEAIGRPSATSVSMGSSGAYDPDLPIQIGMLQTLKSRIGKHGKAYLRELDIIILDEVQYGATSTMQTQLYETYPDTITIGLSATPCTSDGYRLPNWDDVVSVVQTVDLVDMGFLMNPICFAPSKPDLSKVTVRQGDYAVDELAEIMDKPRLVTNVVETYEEFARGKKALVFAVNIRHAEHIAESFQQAGHAVGVLHSKQSKAMRTMMIEEFANDDIRVLVSVDALSVGFDEPSAEVAILARPTKSVPYYLQQVGRVLRLHDSKENAMILDMGNCIANCGHPLKKRDFTKVKPAGRNKPNQPAEIKECDNCGSLLDEDNKSRTVHEDEESITLNIKCRNCGYDLNEITQTKGAVSLEKIEAPKEAMKPLDFRKMTNRFDGYQELRKLAKLAGYKNGWAWTNSQAIDKHKLWSHAAQIFERVHGMGLAPSVAIGELRDIIKANGREW